MRRMEFPPVTSARRTKLLEKLARVHVKKGEAQKLRLPFAYPSQWVDWSTEHSICSSERRERILRVRLGPPGQLIRYRGVGWGVVCPPEAAARTYQCKHHRRCTELVPI